VIGASAAYFLRREGLRVTLLERDHFGQGASHGNCGLVVPGHVLPINSLGNVVKGIGWMFRNDAPLLIRPRQDPAFLNWLLHFIAASFPGKVMDAATGRAALLEDAIDLYSDLIGTEEMTCNWEKKGALHLFDSQKGTDAFAHEDVLARQFGQGATRLKGNELADMEPAVGQKAVGAWYSENVSHLRPDLLMEGFRILLNKMGVEIRERTVVTGFEINGESAAAAETPGGAVAADHFVVATGAWTPFLGGELGCRLPIQPGKGYSVVLKDPEKGPSIPTFFEAAKVVATPHTDGLRIGGTMEFAGYDDRLNRDRLDMLYETAWQYLPGLRFSGVTEEWCGWRPMTCDGLPVIDRSPRFPNVIIAAGHNMEGISMAPRTGKLVAEMVTGKPAHIDLYPYRIR